MLIWENLFRPWITKHAFSNKPIFVLVFITINNHNKYWLKYWTELNSDLLFVLSGSLWWFCCCWFSCSSKRKRTCELVAYHEHLSSYKYFHQNSYILQSFFHFLAAYRKSYTYIEWLFLQEASVSESFYIQGNWCYLISIWYLIIWSYNIKIYLGNVTDILGWRNMLIHAGLMLGTSYFTRNRKSPVLH